MRHFELYERKVNIADEERGEIVLFITDWLKGDYMRSGSSQTNARSHALKMWQRIHDLFPPKISAPITLMRLVTLPIEYATQKTFHLEKPAPGLVGSWTSTHFGLESVQGVSSDLDEDENTCRLAIRAKISPENILATYRSLGTAFLSLTRDYDYEEYEVNTVTKRGGVDVHSTSYKPYLGMTDSSFHDDLGYYQSLFREMTGGPLRQYEYIVKTTPLDVQNIKVFRIGNEMMKYGHDDPHNSGRFRGWVDD